MAAEIPLEHREQVLSAIDAGLSRAAAARLFQVSISAIKRWQHRRRETGSPTRLPRPGRPSRIAPDQYAALHAQRLAYPTATVSQHCARWETAQGVRISRSTMWRALQRMPEQHCPDAAAIRAAARTLPSAP